MKVNHLFFPILLFFFFSCKTAYQPVSQVAQLYAIKDSIQADTISPLAIFLKPYRDSLSAIMNAVIGSAEDDLLKDRPSGSLGNLVVKAIAWKADILNDKLLGSICNYGGLRTNQISKGAITTGKIYELLPFENELVILEIKGDVLEQWLNHIASSGGWPLAFRQSFEHGKSINQKLFFKGNKLVQPRSDTSYQEMQDGSLSMRITKNEFKKDQTYFVATNDYLANGGENCNFLKSIKRTNTGILIRDILLEYIQQEKIIKADSSKSIILEE